MSSAYHPNAFSVKQTGSRVTVSFSVSNLCARKDEKDDVSRQPRHSREARACIIISIHIHEHRRGERSSYIMNGRKRTLASKRRFSANSSVIMCANVFMHLHSKTDYLYSHHRKSLLRLVDDLLNATDEEEIISVQRLLDLSAAFDSVDH